MPADVAEAKESIHAPHRLFVQLRSRISSSKSACAFRDRVLEYKLLEVLPMLSEYSIQAKRVSRRS